MASEERTAAGSTTSAIQFGGSPAAHYDLATEWSGSAWCSTRPAQAR